MKKLLFIILSVAFLAGCDKKIDEYPASSNGVDFSNYVAVGNSLTSGHSDNALYLSGQQNSYPNILASQFQTVGGGAFRQPLIGTEDGVGFTPIPGGLYYYTKLALKIVPDKDCQGNPTGTASLKPAVVVDNPDQNTLKQQLFSPPTVAGPYNNMGVTGATVQSIFYNRLGDPT
ncbi:MAG: membrane lipoprotein lipid attachment site-containing protein, partial [Bacteroidales bacterium]|nr:membrane lipoprotein lipid attachment site-containing protein [Bacteroidales bacterium]